jgi:hypothetical protein
MFKEASFQESEIVEQLGSTVNAFQYSIIYMLNGLNYEAITK